MHIILLDDDPDELFFIKMAFDELGLQVQLTWFQTFEQMCDYLALGNTADWILLDINLPKQTGIECLQQFRTTHQSNSVPVIMYTNSDYKPNIDECFSLGATVYLKKRNSVTDLKRRLTEMMGWDMKAVADWPLQRRTLISD